jgi:heme/copper-type cytochrome/quinol oxidase subunit 2
MNSTQGQSQATRSSAPPYLALIALTSCAGHIQSMVDPGGPQAGRILTLWWFFFSLLAAIFIVVVGFTLWTLLLRRPGATDQELLETQHNPSPRE